MRSSFLAPLSLLYGGILKIRHRLFDLGVLASKEYDIPIICVGNLTVGGTGKTPFTEMLVAHFATEHNVAVLSRGYGRKTKGYREVKPDDSFLNVGDEPKQIKLKYPNIVVAVCEKRAVGIDRIRAEHPNVDLIILDDAFQHRYVEPWVNIILTDYSRPMYKDRLLPWGNLRDSMKQLYRAQIIVVTKCPENLSPLDRRIVSKYLALYPYQKLFFTHYQLSSARALFPDTVEKGLNRGDQVILMSGIGNPEAFENQMKEHYTIMDHVIFGDHHKYRKSDLVNLQTRLKELPDNCVVLITEKDAVKLTNKSKIPEQLQRKLFFIPIDVEFIDEKAIEFFKKIDNDVKTNSKYGLRH